VRIAREGAVFIILLKEPLVIRYMAIGLLAQILLCALVPRAEAQDKTAAKAKTMNTQELVELSRLEFNLIDADKNGHISQKELDSRAKSLFNSLDKDKDGSLSKTEFLDIPPQVAIKLLPQDVKPKRSRKELAEDAFKALDSDGDGKISRRTSRPHS
jgi:Ca2+-binding EF-hand superfamily protein